ncbi:MAG: arylsulfatase [bacterium]|nr:arylsulfatase [bacterium]
MSRTTRRAFLTSAAAAAAVGCSSNQEEQRRPNVVLVMTDDQGYGDLSIHGNPHLQTPHTDRVAQEGVRFTQFQVCPVCAPTRASLMTGRYNFRTGVVDTWMGRALMHADEVTLPEVLGAAGYKTGIFGKWHLGDNYPLRPIDQGFQEALVHNGGGIGQPSDPPGNTYFDPVLQHNGTAIESKGYCTDIFFDAAAEFIEQNRGNPFFTYIATNAPHTPLQVDESLVEPFRAMGIDDTTSKIYGMCKNIDDNMGKLLAKLSQLDIERDTILIFMTDNGPQQPRYNADLRSRKGRVYQGGIRVPFFVRWPAAVKAGGEVSRIAAHIDVFPTLLEACGVAMPADVAIDGRSLLPLARGDAGDWPDRTLFTQWHRGDAPEAFRDCAARTQRYKLINGEELYDLDNDPGEQTDVAADNPDIVARLRTEYEHWLQDVSSTRGYEPPRIYIGTEHENPVILTRQDWRGPKATWKPDGLGYWEVDVRTAGRYEITLRTYPAEAAGTARFKLNNVEVEQPFAKGATECKFDSVEIEAGEARAEPWLEFSGKQVGVRYLDVRKLS